MNENFPDCFETPDPYNIPIHDQGNKNSCVLHALAVCIEEYLSEEFKERTLIDVDDWWDNMLKYGMATTDGTTVELAMEYISKHGVKYTTDSGKCGIYRTQFREMPREEFLSQMKKD